MAYQPYTNRKAQHFTRAIIDGLTLYMAEHQRKQDIKLQPLTYTYKARIHLAMKCGPFSELLSRILPFPTVFSPLMDLPNGVTATKDKQSLTVRPLHQVTTIGKTWIGN